MALLLPDSERPAHERHAMIVVGWVDIVIVNWNAGRHLRECVDSALEYGGSRLGRIIVVDNGSTDGSADALEASPRLTVIRAGTNLGFARACNIGAAYGASEFVLFLNPDTLLLPGSLDLAVGFMLRPGSARVGICGVQLIDDDGRVAHNCARFPSAGGIAARAVGLDRIFPAVGHCMRDWDHATTREVDQVMGAFFLVRRSLFNTLQGFDERFFVYFEDMDFAYRARQGGWSSVYLAEAQALHSGGVSSRQVKATRLFYVLRSRILYAFKHLGPFAAMTVVVATLLIEPIARSMLALAQRSWASLKETWAAYRMLIAWLPQGIANETRRNGVLAPREQE